MQRKILYGFLLLGSMSLILAMQQDPEPSPKQIIQKAEKQLQGKSSKGKITIKTVRPSWSNEMTVTMWSLGDEYAMTLINEPVKNKGIATLKRGREVWMWNPRIESLTKLPPSMMSQSWMGTDFSNDDLVSQSSMVDDYDQQLAEDSTLLGRKCWHLVLTPKPDATVIWGQLDIWIDQENYMQLLTRFYDEDQELVNTLKATKVGKLGDRTLPTVLEMIPATKEGHKTVMEYQELAFDVDLKEAFFTPRNMKTLRP